MPNYFRGTVQIIGSPEDMKEIHKWTIAYDSNEEKPSFNTLCPLPSMGDTWIEEKWDYDEACDFYTSKWGITNPQCISSAEHHGQHYIDFIYDSAWCMPMGLFKMLEDKYNVSVYSEGHDENNQFIEVYKEGEYIYQDIDYTEFRQWFADMECIDVDELPPIGKDTDISEWHDGCFLDNSNDMEFMDYLIENVKDTINRNGGEQFKH